MSNKIGNLSNYLAALICFTFGVVYLFKTSFMPYHGKALGLDWNELDASKQFVFLASMKALAGGFLAVSFVVFVLQNKFAATKINWIPWLILLTGLIINVGIFYATTIVRYNTPANPPMMLSLFVMLLLVIGYVFNKRVLTKPE